MYEHFNTPQPVRSHMRAVADFLEALLQNDAARIYDAERLRKAALVHDLARTQPRHEQVTADYLLREGYGELAALVRPHHSPEDDGGEALTEAELLFYADKRVRGAEPVSVEERFAASLAKCKTPEALQKHAALEAKTYRIQEKIRRTLCRDVTP